jgi:hypothetical protein
MGTSLNVSLVVECVLAVLLTATLFYCALLESRLRLLRKDHAQLSTTIHELNSGILRAQSSLATLRAAAADADTALGKSIGTARGLADELSILTSGGERVAQRIEAARSEPAVPVVKIHAPAPQTAVRAVAPGLVEKLRAVR